MKLKKLLSILSAAVITLSCIPVSSVNALSSDSSIQEYYVPDFPQEVLDEFQISWTGLTYNQLVENNEFDMNKNHNKLLYDGGYAMYIDGSNLSTLSYSAYWHDCNNFMMYQSTDFTFPEYDDKLELMYDITISYQIKKEGILKMGPLLELNGGSDELFVIENYSSVTDFSDNEKIGSYTSDNTVYDLYKTVSDDESPVRYISVNTNGVLEETLPDTFSKVSLSSKISDHLSKLNELTDIDIILDKYGILTEGENGIGNALHLANMVSSYVTLPEEKISYGDDNSPISYDRNMMKNLDGYRYSLQTTDSNWPINEFEGGKYYEFTKHENNSYIIPSEDGKCLASVSDGISSTVSVGKEYDGKTPLLDKNYQYDYKYTLTDYNTQNNNINIYATVWMLDPYVKIDFLEKYSNYGLFNDAYIGSIVLNGERYDIYEQSTINHDLAPLFNKEYKNYSFIRKNTEDNNQNSEIIERSIPISALLENAKIFGIESGNLCRINLNTDSFNDAYTINILENNIIDNAPPVNGKYFVDASLNQDMSFDAKLGQYVFNSYTQGYMYGYENGCFSAASVANGFSSFNAGIKKKYGEEYTLDSEHRITADYKIENNFDDKYQIGYCIDGLYDINGNNKNIGEIIRIIEKSENYSLDNNWITAGFGMRRYPSQPEPEFIKTYTAGGHEYDLYRDYCTFYENYGESTYENYVSIRKDQTESNILEGSIDVNEHISQISKDLYENLYICNLYLTIDVEEVEGTAEVSKNDIVFDSQKTPNEITDYFKGDINADGIFNIADAVTLQKWLSGNQDIKLTNWKAIDLCEDDKLDVFDLVLVKDKLINQ